MGMTDYVDTKTVKQTFQSVLTNIKATYKNKILKK